MNVDVFQFNDPVDFLNTVYTKKKENNPSFSLRSWAKQMKIPHHSMLSMVLAKKRRLLPLLGRQIGETLKLSEDSSRYFDLLILYSNAATQHEKEFYSRLLAGLRPDKQFCSLKMDIFRVISDWYHFAILEMTELPNFVSDPEWICQRLGGSVNQSQAIEAIERLKRVELLEESKDGKLKKTAGNFATTTDIPVEGLRKFHKQMIEKGAAALDAQSVERRDVTGHMIPTRYEKIAEAKRMIRDFRKQLAKFMECEAPETVYQLNVQLFDLLVTENRK